jgi:hypothetical protein
MLAARYRLRGYRNLATGMMTEQYPQSSDSFINDINAVVCRLFVRPILMPTFCSG